MVGLDHLIGQLAHGQPALVALAVALLLGLRHATDPDHLVAVSTLIAAERERPARRAGLLGLAWGGGHATTLALLGTPVVAFGATLPAGVERGAEALVGAIIVALALRLLLHWRRGRFHAHEHAHGLVVHRHLHAHEQSEAHRHDHVTIRSPLQAFGIGVVHGAGGSAAVGLLLLASIGDPVVAAVALLLFAAGTAASMAAVSAGFGYLLGRESARRGVGMALPGLALLALAFGLWYGAAAVV